jgi:hypothetical protein
MPDQLEEKAVPLSAAKAGVALKAGHTVVLIVDGGKGTPPPLPRPRSTFEPSRTPEDTRAAALMQARALTAGPPKLAGDPNAKRAPGPLSVKGATWGHEGAAIGDDIELSAEVNGTDVSGLEFRVKDPDNKTIATLPVQVKGTQALLKWKVPASESEGEEYDFGAWKGADCFNRSGKLKVADIIHAQLVDEHSGEILKKANYEVTLHDGSVRTGVTDEDGFIFEDKVPPGSYTVTVGGELEVFDGGAGELNIPIELGPKHHGISDRPPIQYKHLRVLRVGAKPMRAMEGGKVTLRAQVIGGEGEKVVFRIYRGGEKKPFATAEGKVSAGTATAQWTVSGVKGAHQERAFVYDEFDIEAECHGMIARSHGAAELRGYRRTK